MAAVTPGYTIEQKVVTVANNDSAINTEITTQAVGNWLVTTLIISGSNVIILFTRTVVDS